MLEKRHAEQRGTANFGWLNSKHSFSFGSYRDPQQNGFSDLLVINDDTVAPAGGFDSHPHQDMEIFSYVLDGALEHKDSMGTGSVIRVGDVQAMSAGTGVVHSEFNHSSSAGVHFLQIWIVPAQRRVQPRYQQRHFTNEEKRGKLRLIISPDAAEGSLAVWQDVRGYAGLFDGTETASLTLPPNRHAYVHVARGSVTVNGERFQEGDGARLRNVEQITITEGNAADVLVFDLRPHELPRM